MSRLSTKEKLFFVFLLGLMGASGYLLFQDESAFLNQNTEQKIANLEAYENTVKYRSKMALGWRSARSGTDLFNGEQIFTHENSSARIRYKDGSVIDIEDNTLLRITEGSNGLDLDLSKGFLVLNFKGKKDIQVKLNGKVHTIKANNAKLQLKRTGNNLSLGVLSGSASLNNKKVKKGSELDVVSSKVKKIGAKKKEFVPPAVVGMQPLTGKKYIIPKGEESVPVKLAWQKKSGNNYEIQFKPQGKKVWQKKTRNAYLNFKEVKMGNYTWRVRSLSRGKKGKWSKENFFSVIKTKEFKWVAPGNLKEFIVTNKPEAIDYQWEPERNSDYKLRIIRRDARQEKDKVQTLDMKGNSFRLLPRNTRNFEWEFVNAKTNAVMKSGRVVYRKIAILPRPNQNITLYSPEQRVQFSWRIAGGKTIKYDKYKFEFSETKDFKKVVLPLEITYTRFKLPYKKLKKRGGFGKLYWRVSVFDKKTKKYVKQKGIFDFNLRQSKRIDTPNIKRVIRLRSISKLREEYPLRWTSYKHIKNYKLEIYKDPLLKKRILTKTLNSNSYVWEEDVVNTYYYRVQTRDLWGRRSRYSKVGTLVAPIAPFYK